MKSKFYSILTFFVLFSFTNANFAQAPNLGTAANFVLFTTTGAVSNTGITNLTGDVGTNTGAISGFGNINGVIHNGDAVTAQAAADLLVAYGQLNSAVPTASHSNSLGNGNTMFAGVYSIGAATTLNSILTLDAQGNANAVFIFQINGAFSTGASSQVQLINGAQACNVFWKVEGLISMATNTIMRGTMVANNAAINMNTGDILEGRALSTTGAITTDGTSAYIPMGCGGSLPAGPPAPNLSSPGCYALFSSVGAVTNTGITFVTGDIGSNLGLVSGFNPLNVTGTIHSIPDASTATAAADLTVLNTYLTTLPFDIELLFPAQFGNNLVLTPHVYRLSAATTLTGSVFLDAEGNPNAVFIIQIQGALTTSTFSKVLLINGAQRQNVYWKIDGAVTISDNSEFKGTIVSNGAIILSTGTTLEGRALTTVGAITTSAVNVIMPPGCGTSNGNPPNIITPPSNQTACTGGSVSFSVVATGTGLTYQWRKGTVNLTNGGNISGANTSVLTINPVSVADAASNYNVIVSGTVAPNDTSIDVSLTVNTGAVTTCSITVTPANNTFTGGDPKHIYLGYGPQSATLTVTASGGSSLTYSWTGSYLSSTTGSSVVFTPTVAGTYLITVTVTNSAGCQKKCSVTMCVSNIKVPGNGNSGKVYLCHLPPGNPANEQTLSISTNAVPAHLSNHAGDKLGSCGMSCGNNKNSIAVSDVIIEKDDNGIVELYVSPNPFSGEFKLSYFSYSKETATIMIYDMAGRLVTQTTATGYENNLSLGSELAGGIYTVTFTQGNTRKVFKVSKTF